MNAADRKAITTILERIESDDLGQPRWWWGRRHRGWVDGVRITRTVIAEELRALLGAQK